MQTTKLYVEYIVIGMESLVWIVLLVLMCLGKSSLVFFDYCIQNLLTSIFMIGACYVLGLLTDRVNCTPCQGQFQRCESVPLDGYRFYYPRKLFKSTLAEPLSMDSLTS